MHIGSTGGASRLGIRKRTERRRQTAIDARGVSSPSAHGASVSKRLRWVGFTLGAILGAFVAYDFWPLAHSLFAPHPTAVKAGKQPAPQLIAPAPPIPSDPKLAAVGTDSSVSKVPLPLVLVGTIPGRNSGEGSAMLGTDARNAQTYLAHALLENGARLTEIYRDRVILERNGERATLYLMGATGAGTNSTAKSLLTVGGESSKLPVAPHYSVDPVTDYIRAVPYYRDDVVAGFRVFPGARSGPFNQWGLKSGDVVTSVDGSPLMDADQTTQLLSALAEGASLSARVLRGSETVTVALNGADIARLSEARAAPPVAFQTPP